MLAEEFETDDETAKKTNELLEKLREVEARRRNAKNEKELRKV